MKTAIANEDKEIRNYFADIVIPIPSEYDEFIQERISHASAMNVSGVASPRKILRLKRTIMLVAVIIVLIVGSITVAASIGAYNERMSKLSDEDKQTLVDNADKIKKEGWQTSRPMTESEQERLEKLEQKYLEELLIPQNALLVVNDMSEIIEEQLCFYPKDNYFNYPEREMTDDELLQIIDYRMTTDYALKQRMWANQPELDEKPEEELIKNAVAEVSKFFSLSSEYSTSTHYYNIVDDGAGGYYATADVYITDKKTGRSYTVNVERLQGFVKRFDRTDANYSHENVPINEEHFRKILNNYRETAEKISEQKCIYNDLSVEMIDDTYIDGGSGCCCYKMSDGSWVLINFVVKDGELLGITESAHEDYVDAVREGWAKQSMGKNTKTYRIIGDIK